MPWGKEGNEMIRILLVEDNPGDDRLIREMLKEVNSATIELTCAESLEVALQAIASGPFTIILLDLNLPDSAGIETFIRMRDMTPDIPIVVFSGLDDEDVAVHAVEAGAQDYLVKGHVDGTLLVRAIRYALERNRMRLAIRNMSLNDELTGLYNRRGFLTLAGQQLKTAERVEKKAALVYIDLDGMKRINDTFGHNEGNQALRDTAEILRKTFRKADIIARLGGDEFVVLALLEGAEANDSFCGRLEEHLAQLNAGAGRQYPLALSYGVTLYKPFSPTSIEELVDEADRLMYEQKKGKKAVRETT
jgi:diguanylate cyclase (GGDEF)-like protein